MYSYLDALDEYTKAESSDSPKISTHKPAQTSSKSTPLDQNSTPSNPLNTSNPINEQDLQNFFSKEISEQLSKGLLDLIPSGSEIDENVLGKEMESLIKQFSSMDPATLDKLAADMGIDTATLDPNAPKAKPEPPKKSPKSQSKSAPSVPSSAPKSTPPPPSNSSFKDKVSSTINKLSESNEFMAQKEPDIDPFMGLLNQAGGLDGLVNDKEMEEMLEQIMKEMSTKDILYEPMKTLMVEYPKFFESKGSSCSPEDLSRYEKQFVYISEITSLFERPDYESAPIKTKISNLLEKTQECGDPPKDILDAIAPDSGISPSGPIFGASNSGFPKDDQCLLM
ncbi:Peroxisome biogenesis protein 19-1 [Smittium mucronatum]|uniref:Peroxisome biogenesis protein 19-1 n=1 Tax=Smittium mucronatum TaxID=133383 RepID=A0A1R0GP56_9FUNG|nr:Peroxisome biogenesis protein 19-1 [Smittium mucronatum]